MASPKTSRIQETSSPTAGIGTKQRLVICLDGTWNKQDSGTNIYHLSNLIQEGEVADHWLQRVYYDPGVGTGILDGVTGGAFGIGLSENVREAYDWLVEHYNDEDEVYIFGFSRGAFTARSLVGLIAKCGLLRRGAPISPEELWAGYRILGRLAHEKTGGKPAKNWWERIAGRRESAFRPIWPLVPDPWEKGSETETPKIEDKKPLNRAEKLLVTWSRRIKITCVGVFDTVGSMGLDALAIPWLRDKVTQFHDTHLTSLIVNGFQALALDENRSNFIHIPWHRETNSKLPAGKTQLGGSIEQRWFIGAHSNIGGGYEDDVLARLPLKWFIKKCRTLKVVFRERNPSDPNPEAAADLAECVPLLVPGKAVGGLCGIPPRVRDSFVEFASPFWQHLIRAKREYRRLVPPPEMQNGVSVQSVNETLDESVLELKRKNSEQPGARAYLPPNLWAYLKATQKEGFTEKAPPHRYLEGWAAWAWLAAWLVGIGVGGWKIERLLGGCGCTLSVALPILALLVDWRESVLNHGAALDPAGMLAEKRKAWVDFYLAVRLWAFAAFVFGVLVLLGSVVWPFLLRGWPPSHEFFLLVVLDALFLWAGAAMGWCAAPMNDAGFGSIVQLQNANSPGAVISCFAEWIKSRGEGVTADGSRQLLMPVVRCLWRDMLGFIPSYSLVLFMGMWLLLSLFTQRDHLLESFNLRQDCWTLCVAAGFALLCAGADYMEDIMHLGYIRAFPDEPSVMRVRIARAMTLTKLGCLFVGFPAAWIAGLWLTALEFVHMRGNGGRGGSSCLLGLLTVAIVAVGVHGTYAAWREAKQKTAS